VDESTLTVDPESLQLELDHSFSSSWGGNEVRAVVPQTHVRLHDSLKDLVRACVRVCDAVFVIS
jgi:hypothetical protein